VVPTHSSPTTKRWIRAKATMTRPDKHTPTFQQSPLAQVRAGQRRASGQPLVHARQQLLEQNQQMPAAHHGSLA